MKNIFHSCALVLTVFLLFSAGNSYGQGAYKINTLRFFDTCSYQSFLVERFDTGRVNLETTYGDGTRDTNIIVAQMQWFWHNYTAIGSYSVKSVIMNAAYARLDSTTIVAEVHGCELLYGLTYKDNNANCSYDAGDKVLYYPIQIKVDSAGHTVDTITAFGSYFYKALGIGKTYTFTVINAPATLAFSCPSTGSLSVTSTFGAVTLAGDLGFTCASPAPSGFDVAVIPYARAGRHAAVVGATLTTTSCTSKTGTISLTMDSKYAISGSYPPGGTISGHTVTWSYSGLAIDSPQYFSVSGSVTPYLTIGDAVEFKVATPVLSGETDTTNNKYTINDTVMSSWDPNDKHVLPAGNIKAGQTLTYTLNFENTGNAPAKNIHVLDTLSSLVDPQSVRVISATHPMKMYSTIDATSGKTTLKFDFPNIMLKDSSHHGECDGSVTFTVNVKKGLPDGTNITNRGGIYFDDNDVVLTNTTSSVIATTSIPDVYITSGIAVYPNPVHNELQLQLDNEHDYTKMVILNTIGQVMMQQDIKGSTTRVNVSTLAPGIYFMQVTGAHGTAVTKIEKL